MDATLTLLTRSEEERAAAEEEGEVAEPEDLQSGYSSVYAQLHHAGKSEEDPVQSKTNDPRQFLTVMLGQLCSQNPGRYPPLIGAHLQPSNQAALAQWCTAYSVALA